MPNSPRIDELRRRVLIDPASIAFAALAEEYRRSGRYLEAIATCQAGLRRHPAYLSARITLGRALLAMGACEAARDQLEHVLRVAPGNLAAREGLGEIAGQSDWPQDFNRTAAGVTDGCRTDRTLARLESFLAAILRAKDQITTSGVPGR